MKTHAAPFSASECEECLPSIGGRASVRSVDPSGHPRVLFVGVYIPSTLGSRAVSEDVAGRLAQEGWHVRLTSRKTSRYVRVLDLARTILLKRKSFDVAHVDVYSGAAFRWAELATGLLRTLRCPYVVTLHGGNLPELAQRYPGRLRRVLQGSAVVTAPSRYLVDAVRHVRNDIRLLPNPIELRDHTFRPRTRPAARLIWLRAFHEIYNPTMAVRTLRRLVDVHTDIRLSMIGPEKDGSIDSVRAAAQGAGVESYMDIRGGVTKKDVPRHLDIADIFLNTTNIDNSPVSVLEAMASGLCIISTNVGGIPHLLEHGREALLVPPNDDAAMAAAVHRVLTEPGLAGHLSVNARSKAERFGWSTVLPLWCELLTEVGSGRNRRDD